MMRYLDGARAGNASYPPCTCESKLFDRALTAWQCIRTRLLLNLAHTIKSKVDISTPAI